MTARPPHIPAVSLADYHYDLPADRIALHPLEERDASRLLVCDVTEGSIGHRSFRDLPALIPGGALLVVNATRVVRARIIMHRPSGGRVEIFLIEPVEPSNDPALALGARGECVWACMVGGAKKLIKEGEIQRGWGDVQLVATVAGEHPDGLLIRFRWTPADLDFAGVLETAGRVPLPPYIRRDALPADTESYQTVYARHEGAVAAPTAGLHFTPRVLEELRQRGVAMEQVTLHVGAGTFRQVKGSVEEHDMHRERIVVAAETLRGLIAQARRRAASDGFPLIPVGTTSLRTLESLFWFGARLMLGETTEGADLLVGQWDPYRLEAGSKPLPDLVAALEAVEEWRVSSGLDAIAGHTGIMILPGYRFRACDALITNFHQPESTLILLVGALMGRDLWRRVYDEALAEGYRFLSYGDSSLIIVSDRMRNGVRKNE
ncbi:MAG: S-adenosylmethionine:tRNA ribosyltransferase-isomerase [Chlorobi bacterium]|nr:S-adenosylmethionine:tRNA ribosyltransferase-isomerase [Chlorobiota bacterium]